MIDNQNILKTSRAIFFKKLDSTTFKENIKLGLLANVSVTFLVCHFSCTLKLKERNC